MKKLCISLLGAGLLLASAGAAEKTPLNVRDFGAKGDGLAKDTVALQRALDECATNGGGTVYLPEGVYLTGSLLIGPNTTLQLASRANLIGSPEIADYPLVNIRWEGEFREGHRALLAARNGENLTITGGGSIFGPPLSVSRLRNPRGPALIELENCTNVVLEGFSTQYQQLWSVHTLFCKNLTARNLTIRSINVNGDGLDIDSCDGVLIDHCDINTGDDAISLKSGRGLAAQNLARPTRNVTIRDSRLQSSIYAAIGLGTEMSGGIRDVKLENCVLSGRQNAIFIKSRDGRGGFMENISGKNLTVLRSPTFIGIDLKNKGIQATDPVPGETEKWPLVRNISFKDVQVQDVNELVQGRNIPAARLLDGFTLADISGTCLKGISLMNMTNVNLSGIKVTGYEGPLVTVENVTGHGLNASAAK
jgi:polygalacturonase